jgi:hypothetical protein
MAVRSGLAAVFASALVFPSAANAKIPFPSAVRLTGPELTSIEIGGGKAGRRYVAKLAGYTGFFEAALPRGRRPILSVRRPAGHLGPKYEIRFRVPRWRWDRGYTPTFYVTQDVYPYAVGGPVTYMKPGRKLFGFHTGGGWFRASGVLKQMLVRRGLPASAATTASSSWSQALLIGTPGVLLLCAAIALVARRRKA